MNHATRAPLYKAIEAERESKVLSLFTGERIGWETQIAHDAARPMVALLDKIGPVEKLTLLLDTNGGQVSAAWKLIRLIRSFADDVEVIVFDKAMSAGTLMSLGADRIVMTKQATLGPIDPSLTNHPLAPPVQLPTGQIVRVSVSAEAVRGYIDEVKKDVTEPAALAAVWTSLATQIHPLVLGDIFRMGDQIRKLARELIQGQVKDQAAIENIIQLLCSDSGSHDYTVNRRQATDLGLVVEKCTADLYASLSGISDSLHGELKTLEPFDAAALLAGNPQVGYQLVRGLIESADESYGYVSEGRLAAGQNNPPDISDHRTFEGWRKLP